MELYLEFTSRPSILIKSVLAFYQYDTMTYIVCTETSMSKYSYVTNFHIRLSQGN